MEMWRPVTREGADEVDEIPADLVETFMANIEDGIANAQRIAAQSAREKLTNGETPPVYIGNLCRIHARGFVASLRLIRRLLDAIRTESPGVDLTNELATLDDALPDISGVRDASAHRDERGRGRIKGKRISSGVVLVECLENNVLISTVGTLGEVGRIEITEATLSRVVETVQAIINRFPWMGRRRTWHF